MRTNLRTNLSNATPEQARERLAELNRQQKCPSCGARRERENIMFRHSDDLVTFLRQNNMEIEQDSCILCVEKHLADADNAIRKAKAANGIEAELFRLGAIGNLREATDESSEFSELHDALAVAERDYRYNGNPPDMEAVAALILKVRQEIAE